MSTTYGPTDRLRQAAASRSSYDAKVIPLDQAKQRYPQRLSKVVRQTEGTNVLSLASRRPAAVSEGQAAPFARRRRRTTTIKQWLPTALFVGVVLGLILLLIAVRMMLSSASASQTAGGAAGAAPAAGQNIAVAVAPPQDTSALAVEAPRQRSIRFSAQPVEPSYTVAAGDNLWSIAQRNRTTVEAVQSINNLPDRATLSVGQRLVMP